MANNNLGYEIIKAFIESVSGVDMSQLRDGINDSVDSAINEAREAVRMAPKNLSSHRENQTQGDYTRMRQEKLYKEREERIRRRQEEKVREREAIRQRPLDRRNAAAESSQKVKGKIKYEIGFPMNRVGSTSSTIYSVVGGIGLGMTGVTLLTSLPGAILGTANLGGLIAGGIIALIFAGVLRKGISSEKTLQLADRYASFIGKKEYVVVSELAAFAGKSEKKIVKEIKMMFKKGFFPQGHLDEGDKTLILTDNVYKQYVETKKRATQINTIDTTARVVEDEFEGLNPEEAAELRQMISEGDDYINKLHELNSRIPGVVITQKLERLESLLKEIFASVKLHPEQMKKMHELMEYYLPTMLKLVTAYEQYDKVSEPGADIIAAKKDIEATLDTINEAFKKLLNNLFKDSVWDVTTDAQVLKTVLAQKGLTNN